MAMQTIIGGLFGGFPGLINSALSFGSLLVMDAATEKVAFVFQAPKTGTIDKAEFRVGTVSINAASVVRVSFQNVAATGNPDGTQDQYRDILGSAISSNSWIVPGLMTSDGTDTGSKRSVTQGELIAFVVEYQSFTAADSVIVSFFNRLTFANLPYCKLFTGSWADSGNASPVIALKYDDGTYGAVTGAFPASSLSSVNFSNASSPDERGLYFQIPFPARIRGAFMHFDPNAAGRDCSVFLYAQGNDSPLATVTLDADQLGNLNSVRGSVIIFSSPVSLSANTNYRLVLRPDTGNVNNIQEINVASAAIMDAFEGGQNWHATERTNGATSGGTLGDGWTQTTTRRPFFAPLFDQFDDGTGGGSTTNIFNIME